MFIHFINLSKYKLHDYQQDYSITMTLIAYIFALIVCLWSSEFTENIAFNLLLKVKQILLIVKDKS